MIMPVLTGFEATRALRDLPETRDCVIIASSASVFSKDHEDSLIAGCDAFLAKPVELDKLLDTIAQHAAIDWIERPPTSDEFARHTVDDAPGDRAPIARDALASLPRPPAETIATLYDLAVVGDTTAVGERIDALAHRSPEYEPFATAFRRMLGSGDDERLVTALESLMHSAP
jgi:CheY-like chemotaxis protein